ncbi:hypothetical protein D9758_005611 [Tetrapyrgos nigripes]|uniref:Chromatin modification-related protein n=1 Tax=Tetrapyrgos nigripes TaxID=182062 RepID=A0A8H5LPA8_9AGAR|nr:hypothetical protein D9758_005611 [Tetrapyrgos nigripes]
MSAAALAQNMEDAANLATEFIYSLDNVPAEVKHYLEEIRHKDSRAQELQQQIEIDSARWVKYSLKSSGFTLSSSRSLSPSPSSSPAPSISLSNSSSADKQTPYAQIPNKITQSYAEIEQLAHEKIALAQKITDMLTRTCAKLDVELHKVRVLSGEIGEGTAPAMGATTPGLSSSTSGIGLGIASTGIGGGFGTNAVGLGAGGETSTGSVRGWPPNTEIGLDNPVTPLPARRQSALNAAAAMSASLGGGTSASAPPNKKLTIFKPLPPAFFPTSNFLLSFYHSHSTPNTTVTTSSIFKFLLFFFGAIITPAHLQPSFSLSFSLDRLHLTSFLPYFLLRLLSAFLRPLPQLLQSTTPLTFFSFPLAERRLASTVSSPSIKLPATATHSRSGSPASTIKSAPAHTRSRLSRQVHPPPSTPTTTGGSGVRAGRATHGHGHGHNKLLDLHDEDAEGDDDDGDADADADLDADADADLDGGEGELDGEAEDEEDGDDETLYCICQRKSFGDMIACDNDTECPYEWFHLTCVGLSKPLPDKWYCQICEPKVRSTGGVAAVPLAASASAQTQAQASANKSSSSRKGRKK